MKASEVQRELQAAREELSAATAALAPKHRGGEWERFLRTLGEADIFVSCVKASTVKAVP